MQGEKKEKEAQSEEKRGQMRDDTFGLDCSTGEEAGWTVGEMFTAQRLLQKWPPL